MPRRAGRRHREAAGRKLIYTNGSRRHAERVAGKLGVLHLFEGIFDIEDSEYIPKPQAGPYSRMTSRHGVDPKTAAMFEDMPHNLAAPHALGMTTVLVHSSYSIIRSSSTSANGPSRPSTSIT